MSFDTGPIDRVLHAAIGDDPTLAAELRGIYVTAATEVLDLMGRARCDANWVIAVERLKSLSGTFGVAAMLILADEALSGAPGDPVVLRRMHAALGAI